MDVSDKNGEQTQRGPELRRVRVRQAEHEQHFYLRMLQQNFRPGIRWLDAGCGHSLIPTWLRDSDHIEEKFLDDAEMIVGADIDTPSLTAPSRIQRVASNLENLPFQDDVFDLITCNMVVEHLSTPSRVFLEFFRVLSPGGLVIILTPNIYHWANIVSMLTPFWFHRQILKRFFNREPEDVFPTLYRANTERKLGNSLRSCGFSDTTVHMLLGRPRLIDFGLLFYPEYFLFEIARRFENLREILCAIAHKPLLATDYKDRRETYRKELGQ